jgi:FkbM family methyltransferase
MKETLINGKYKLILPDHRAARPEWVTGWEVERIESMLSNIQKGDLVLDIGTEEGDISALLAQKSENIILFEPNEKVWPNIRAIWEANNLKWPNNYFVGFASNKDTIFAPEFAQYIPDMNYWPSCAYGDLIGDHGFKELAYETDAIPQVKIDTFASSMLKVETIKLITIDVEGSEFEVLKGAKETIKRDRPLIYVSIHPEMMHKTYRQYRFELVHFVENLGYTFEILAEDHEFHYLFKPI